MNEQYFARHDSDKFLQNERGMFSVDEFDCWTLNDLGYGIFFTVNEFKPGTRRKDTLIKIRRYAVDIDSGTKSEMLTKIHQSPLVPSRVIETKRGFHVYFDVINGEARYWNAIMLDRLVPFFGADPNASDLCRVLRAPGFNHEKDPADQFYIDVIFESGAEYTKEQVARMLPDQSQEKREAFRDRMGTMSFKKGDPFFERVFNMDCMMALEKLSGTKHVNGETFSFKKNFSGTHNILVDGKSTSCWIDVDGRIGSLAKGGPTILQWLKWYGRSMSESIEIVKQEFPDVAE